MSILNQYVNYFPQAKANAESDYYGTKQNLRKILTEMHTSEKHINLIKTLRDLPNEKQADYKKNMLPCFTISGYFEKDGKGSRDSKNEIYRTSLLCLDLDLKNHQVNLKDLKQKVQLEPYVAYCGDSCRGDGIFIIVHISNPEQHTSYFDFFAKWLDNNGCLSVFDTHTKNINRLRFIAPDQSFYLNDNTTPLPFTEVNQPLKKGINQPSIWNNNYNNVISENKIDVALKILEKKSCRLSTGNIHNYIFNLCCIFNRMGINQSEAETFISTLMPLSEIKTNCISYPYKKFTSEFNTWNNNNQYADKQKLKFNYYLNY